MKILVCGASGFIGRSIADHLARAGHEIVRGVRQPTLPGDIHVDFSKPISETDWLASLTGIDVVINAVGIITETVSTRFEDTHSRAPAALFAACVRAGVRRIVQISALGASHGVTPYFTTKLAADQALMRLPIEWQILRPSLVYGPDGTSASIFRMMATLPVVPMPALGDARFQPIHIADLVEGVAQAILPSTPAGQQIDMVGGSPVSFRSMLDTYRQSMRLENPIYLTLPAPLMHALACVSGWIPGAPLTPDTWQMLQAGSAGEATAVTCLLGHPPRPIDRFIEPGNAELMRGRALSVWRSPLLRFVLAFLWIATAITSAFVHPMADSLALLARVGLVGWPATAALHGASMLDFAMGLACIFWPRRALWGFQAGLIVGYTAIIATALPEFLSHPFGPVIKNLPILAILVILFVESKPWTT